MAEQFDAYMSGTYRVISAGQARFDLNVATLNLMQTVIHGVAVVADDANWVSQR